LVINELTKKVHKFLHAVYKPGNLSPDLSENSIVFRICLNISRFVFFHFATVEDQAAFPGYGILVCLPQNVLWYVYFTGKSGWESMWAIATKVNPIIHGWGNDPAAVPYAPILPALHLYGYLLVCRRSGPWNKHRNGCNSCGCASSSFFPSHLCSA
jgi:hypothetical protein